MSTNYYLHPKVTDELKSKMHAAVDNSQLDELQRLIDSIQPVHLGKRAGGWMFLFNISHKKYESNRDSLDAFLHTGTIFDEYGDQFTTEEFWEMVNDWNSRNTYYIQDNDEFNKDGLRWCIRDFK